MLKIRGMNKSFNAGTENEANIFCNFNLDINEC